MANKFAIGLALAGALTGISIGVGQAIVENLPPSREELAAIALYQQQQAEEQRQQEARQQAAIKAQNEANKARDEALGEWAMRAHGVEQAHQDRCWDQLEERGYGDASCY